MAHIQIIENKEVKTDLETKGIFAVIDAGEEVHTACVIEELSAKDVLAMLVAMDELKEKILKDHPSLMLGYALAGKGLFGSDPNSDDDNDEKN